MLAQTLLDYFHLNDKTLPISVKSRTGYVIFFRDAPLVWASKTSNTDCFAYHGSRIHSTKSSNERSHTNSGNH